VLQVEEFADKGRALSFKVQKKRSQKGTNTHSTLLQGVFMTDHDLHIRKVRCNGLHLRLGGVSTPPDGAYLPLFLRRQTVLRCFRGGWHVK